MWNDVKKKMPKQGEHILMKGDSGNRTFPTFCVNGCYDGDDIWRMADGTRLSDFGWYPTHWESMEFAESMISSYRKEGGVVWLEGYLSKRAKEDAEKGITHADYYRKHCPDKGLPKTTAHSMEMETCFLKARPESEKRKRNDKANQ